jgi:GT2 family glycosyltransferase
MALWRRINTLLITFVLPLSLRAERVYRRMESLPRAHNPSLPSLSIIVPARNEAQNLKRLLPSLKGQHFPGQFDLIVVDDASTDDTVAVAKSYGVHLLHLAELSPGWLGKPYACHQGALNTQGEWLLFTDADTVHTPHSAADAVAYAQLHKLDGLSLQLRHETESWLMRTVLMVAFTALYSGLPPSAPILNGQYILIRRDVYESGGGFAAVRDQPLEDLAMGVHLHAHGYRLPMLAGTHVAQVRMYSDTRRLWDGLARLGAGSLRWSGPGKWITALFITGVMLPLLMSISALIQRQDRKRTLFIWAATMPGFIPWSQRFGGSAWGALLAPVGALFVQLAACWGLINHWTGRGIPWKNRAV